MAMKNFIAFVVDDETKRRMDESPIRQAYGVSDYLRTALAKFQEFEERERKSNNDEQETT